jgi:hypothetical protein
MKGRTATSVLRQVEDRHEKLGGDVNQPSLSWRRSSFKDFRLVEGNEGLGNMRHCVATYAESCARRRTSIWSMQMENQRGRHRVLTIEVDPIKRTVYQARRKCNCVPQPVEREIMEQWAAREGLRLAESVQL